MKKFIQMALDFGDKPILSDRKVTSRYEPDTGVLHLTFDILPQELANIVKVDYADGLTHEQVTARLEATTPNFRKVLVEYFNEDGSKFWNLKPTMISMQMTLSGDEHGHQQ